MPSRLFDPGAVYTATAVAARLGVAVETLRTWDRRYGVGPSGPGGRGAGGRRRYGEADVNRLLTMRRLVAGGAPTAEAARAALAESARVSGNGNPAPGAEGGGPAISVAARQGLLRVVTVLDVEAVRRSLTEQVAVAGVQRCWDELLVPILVELGSRWETTGEGVEVEHLLSQVASSVLQSVVIASAVSPGQAGSGKGSAVRPPIVLAAVDGEQHVLVLDALAAMLAEQGHPTLTLGASTPAEALERAVRRLHPGGVFLWARVYRSGLAAAAARLAGLAPERARRPVRFVVGGEGWDGVELSAGVRRTVTLAEAAAVLTEVSAPGDGSEGELSATGY